MPLADLRVLLIKTMEKVHVIKLRDEYTTLGTSKMEFFVISVNSKKPLTNITKRSAIDVAGS